MEAANFGLWGHVPPLDPPLIQGQRLGRGPGGLTSPRSWELC